jgi:hypothetical protein
VRLNPINEKRADRRRSPISVGAGYHFFTKGVGEATPVGESRAPNEQKAAHGRGLLDLLSGDCPERCDSVPGNRYPAARRLSAEDLPERRSATIS